MCWNHDISAPIHMYLAFRQQQHTLSLLGSGSRSSFLWRFRHVQYVYSNKSPLFQSLQDSHHECNNTPQKFPTYCGVHCTSGHSERARANLSTKNKPEVYTHSVENHL